MSANETVHTSTTGGQKAGNNVRVGLIPPEELLEVAELYGRGAAKYSDGNWRKGYPWHLSFDALCRHLFAWWSGEEFDNGEGGTGQEHLDCVIFHAFALKWFRKHRPQFDDRPHTHEAPQERRNTNFDIHVNGSPEEIRAAWQESCRRVAPILMREHFAKPENLDDAIDAAAAPRVVDTLSDNERDAQWTGGIGRYRWDDEQSRWERLPANPSPGWQGHWIPTMCIGPVFGPFTEILEPRTVEKLTEDHKDTDWRDRDGARWGWRDHSHGPGWAFINTDGYPISGWRLRTTPSSGHGPFTEII